VNVLRATLLLFRTHLRRIAWAKRTGLATLVALGPGALAVLISRFPDAPPALEIVAYPGWFIVLQLVVPLVSLLLGSAVVSEEIDDRTITYLFTRPIPRAALLLGRWLATATVLALLAAFSVGALTIGAGAWPAEGIAAPLLVAALLGVLAYSALFATLGTFHKHPMIVGLAYAFAIEGVLANFPGKSQSLTVLFYLRSYVIGRGGEIWMKVKGEELGSDFDSPESALTTIALVVVVALGIGCATISRRQYLLTA
jgi:hypothetical protein